MKTVKIKNLCNKLFSDRFLHVTVAPVSNVKDSDLPIDVMVQDQTSGKTFKARVVALCKYKLWDVSTIESQLSHGLTRDEFIENFIKENPACNRMSQVATFVYEKVN